MARYISVTDIRNTIPEDILARLTDDRPDASPPEIQVSKIEASITKAEAYIDASLAKRYHVPLTLADLPLEVGELVKSLCVDITVYFLYARVESEEKVADKKKHVDKVLDAITEGSQEITGANERRKPGVYYEAAEPIFAKTSRTRKNTG